MIANALPSSPVNFEFVEMQGSKAREILVKAAFGHNCEEIISNWDAESQYVKIVKLCAGLPLALGITGSGIKVEYEDSKDASFSVKSYCSGLVSGRLTQLQGK